MIRLIEHIADASVPWITYYDEASGERTEISARTAQNWIDKTSNFLVDELDAEPRTRVGIYQPTHWQTLVWILAVWQVGATVSTNPADSGPDIALHGPSGPTQPASDPTSNDVINVALSLAPLGMPFDTPPDDCIDFNAEVRGQPDEFILFDEPEGSAPAIDASPVRATFNELLEASPLSDRVQVAPGNLVRDAELMRRLLAGGGSVVIVAGASMERWHDIARTENAQTQQPDIVTGNVDPLDSSRSGND